MFPSEFLFPSLLKEKSVPFSKEKVAEYAEQAKLL